MIDWFWHSNVYVQEAKKNARKMRFEMGASGSTDEVMVESQKKKQQRLERFGTGA